MDRNKLLGSASKKSINIPLNILMSGYIERKQGNIGVHDELFTRCVVLYDGRTKLIFISNDLLEVDREITLSVRMAINEKYEVPYENIMICSTHTHSGPAITTWDLSVKDYIQNDNIKRIKKEITQTIIDNVILCLSDLRPVNIGFIKSECSEIAGNRVEINSISDYSVNIMQITDNYNDVLALMINYTCHPTVLGSNNLLISADFPGVLVKRLENHFINSTAVFFNGACGNQSTRFKRKGQNFDEVERMGGLLFDSVINSLSEIKYTDASILLNAKIKNVTFPKKNFPPREELIKNLEYAEKVKNNVIDKDLPPGEKRIAITKYQGALIALGLSDILEKSGDIKSEIQIFRIGNIEIVGVPVELFVEYGLDIKSRSLSPNTIIAGYANEVLGYVYTREAAEKGSYEVYASPFSADAGEFIVDTVLEMERTLF